MTRINGVVLRSAAMCFTYLQSCRKIFFYSLNTSRLTLMCCHKVCIYIYSTSHMNSKKQAECSVLTIIMYIMLLSVNIISQNEQHTIKYPHISKLTAEECPFADTGEHNAARHHAVLCPAFTSARQQTAVACQTRMRDENAGQQGRNEYLYGNDGKKY